MAGMHKAECPTCEALLIKLTFEQKQQIEKNLNEKKRMKQINYLNNFIHNLEQLLKADHLYENQKVNIIMEINDLKIQLDKLKGE
jgi:hypothetical protein